MPKYPDQVFIARGPNCWGRDFFSAEAAVRNCIRSCPSYQMDAEGFVEFVVHRLTDPKATVCDIDGAINYSIHATCVKVGEGRAKFDVEEEEIGDNVWRQTETFAIEMKDMDPEDQTCGDGPSRLATLALRIIDAIDAIKNGEASVKERKMPSGAPDLSPKIMGALFKAAMHLDTASEGVTETIKEESSAVEA